MQASLFSFLPHDFNYWIGLSDELEEDVWVWQVRGRERGTYLSHCWQCQTAPVRWKDSFEEAAYLNWEGSQPDHTELENCALMVRMV